MIKKIKAEKATEILKQYPCFEKALSRALESAYIGDGKSCSEANLKEVSKFYFLRNNQTKCDLIAYIEKNEKIIFFNFLRFLNIFSFF